MGFFSGILKKIAPIAASFIPVIGPVVAPMVAGAIKAYDTNKANKAAAAAGGESAEGGTDWAGMAGDVLGAGISAYGKQRSQDKAQEAAAQGAQQQNEASLAVMREQQTFNAAEADKTRQFNSAQAVASRDFQKEMSNTQYQRAVGDLNAAGLNPMLAYSQGGAGNVAGATASGPSASAPGNAPQTNVAAAAMSTAHEGAQLDNTLKMGEQIEARTAQIEQDTLTSHASAGEISERTRRVGHEIKLLGEQAQAAYEQGHLSISSKALNYALKELRDLEQGVVRGTVTLQNAQRRKAELEGDLLGYEKSKGKAYSDYYETDWGRKRPYFEDAGTLTHSAGNLGLKIPNFARR